MNVTRRLLLVLVYSVIYESTFSTGFYFSERSDVKKSKYGVRRKVFLNWILSNLSNRSSKNLEAFVSTGAPIIELLNNLTSVHTKTYVYSPKNLHQCLDNIFLALNASQSVLQVNLHNVGIDPLDILFRRQPVVFHLVWWLIIKLHIRPKFPGRENVQPRDLLLQWVNSRLPPKHSISNFNTDWKDGIVLSYLVFGVTYDRYPADRSSWMMSNEEALVWARDWLAIPKLLDGEDMASSDLDELSLMTYIAYFPSNGQL